MRTIVDVLTVRARTTPEKRAYTFLRNGEAEASYLTYGELDGRSRSVAFRLRELGARGRNVLVPLPTGPDFLASFFGCLYAGAVPVPAPANHPRLDAIARDAEVALTIGPAFQNGSAGALDGPEPAPRIAFLQYTSGSTREPRGVMVGHENLMHNLEYAARVEENDEESVSVSWLPLYHDMGLVEGVLQPLYSGYPAYLFSPEAFLEKPLRWLFAITRYRATNSGAPNFAYDLCVRKIGSEERERLDLRSWRVAYNGAEPVRASTLRTFFEAFSSCGFRWRSFYPVYGLAESTLVVTSPSRDEEPTLLEDERAVRVGCGRPRCGVTVEIVDPVRETRAPVGEVWIRSESNALGYWNRPDETRRTFAARIRDTGEGPFLRTGDLGFLRDGELFLVGRRKDVLVVRGKNYHAQDVECTAEGAHPAVRPGGVAAVASEEEDGVVLLVEVSQPDEAIPALMQRAVAETHGLRLQSVALLPPRTLLKTSSGKLRRAACREAYLAGKLEVLALSTFAEELDSLGAFERAARLGVPIEGVPLPEDLVLESGSPPAAEPRAILLTGANGFLGAHLLRELLDRTQARIFCLVRRGSPWRDVDERRVVPLWGDLTLPFLGLSEETFERLSQSLDAIVHSGASVSFVASYRELSPVNVDGTLELLKLAFRGRTKRFHFLSTLGVGYTTSASTFSETADALPHLSELHLGYAETKAVAESLVRQAADRGLPASIYRLALLTGEEASGRGNENDLLSRLIRACVHRGTAPDLEVEIDACPVDYAARAVVALALEPAEESLRVFHIRNESSRSFRELVLFLNLFGYDVALEPYRNWLPSPNDASDPLHPLKPFFEGSVNGVFLPERYEEGRRTKIESAKTREKLERLGISSRRASPSYLSRCFRSFIAKGALPKARERKEMPDVDLCDSLSRALGFEVERVALTPSGTEQSILTEITSWYSGRGTGLYRAEIRSGKGTMRAFLKIKPSDRDVLTVARAVAELSSPRLGAAFERFERHIGFAGTHERELDLYRSDDPRLRSSMPRLYGMLSDVANERFVLVLEELPEEAGRQSLGRSGVDRAIEGLARIHAVGYGRESRPRSMAGMRELWEALFEHATPCFREWGGDDFVRAYEEALVDLERWSKELSELPRTLIHNDFNPRNLYLPPSGALVVFDWELATTGPPQRDLAELLCFTLTPDDDPAWFLERYRRALERETGTSMDPAEFRHGFELALQELLVDRLAMYTLIHRFQKKRFLEPVVRTWLRLERSVDRVAIL
jgi:thioester reductase-like protein